MIQILPSAMDFPAFPDILPFDDAYGASWITDDCFVPGMPYESSWSTSPSDGAPSCNFGQELYQSLPDIPPGPSQDEVTQQTDTNVSHTHA